MPPFFCLQSWHFVSQKVMAVIQLVCSIHLSQRKELFMNFSESYPGAMIMVSKCNPAEAVTETRVIVPSAVILKFLWPLWMHRRQTQ